MILHIHLKSMPKKRGNIFLYLLIFVIILSSCGKKNQQIDYNIGVFASQEYVQSQQMMNLLLNTYFKSITDSLLIINHFSEIDGAEVSYFETPEEKIVIAYSALGTDDLYGHRRAGTITATPNIGFYDSLAVINLEFSQFEYDEDAINVKSLSVTNSGRIDGVNYTYHIMAESIQRTYADSTGMTRFNMDQTLLQLKDPSTIFHSPEDQFEITGVINGISSTNHSYTANISEQEYLLNQFSCNWFKLGPAILNFESQTYEAFILFPGADTCINRYAVGIDDNPFYYPFD